MSSFARARIDIFLANNMGSSDPGTATRKQHGGIAAGSVALIVKATEDSVAASIARSSLLQLPGFEASK